MKFNLYTDAGHGWLKVPLQLLNELGIADAITRYSYMCVQYAYLEEDKDAATFIAAMREAGKRFSYTAHNCNNSKIRSYAEYNPQIAKAGGIKDNARVKLWNNKMAQIEYLYGKRYVHIRLDDNSLYKATKQTLASVVLEVVA